MKKGARFYAYILAAAVTLVLVVLATAKMSGVKAEAEELLQPSQTEFTLETALQAAGTK